MSGLFHDAAHAALPVALALVVLAGAARAVLWAQLDDPRWERIAREHLEPLTTWAVAAAITYALTLVAAAETSAPALALALGLALVAALARVEREPRAPVAVPESQPAAAPAPAPAPDGALWARPPSL